MQPLIDALLEHFPAGDDGLMALVDLTVLVAVADGRIDDAEMAALTESIEALIGSRLAPSLVAHLVNESRSEIRAIGPSECARAVGAALSSRGAAEDGIRLAIAIAAASEGLSPQELERIGELAHAAGVTQARLDELIAAHG